MNNNTSYFKILNEGTSTSDDYNKETNSYDIKDLTSNTLKDTILKKEENKMSIVGILKCTDGKVIAFGDSKSSMGQSEELERVTQKVFKFNDFIMVTFGYNKIDETNLEDIINKYNKNINYSSLFEDLSTKYNLFNKKYEFLIFSKDSKYLKYIVISQNKINIEFNNSHMWLGGDERYRNYILNNFKQYFSSSFEAKKYYEIELEKLVYHFENELVYNPCGLPIKVEIF